MLESSLAHINFSNIFDKKVNMEIGLYITVKFELPDLKIGIILAVLKQSGKASSDNELLKSIETVGEIIGARILYVNTGIFMRSVDLFFCQRIMLTISSLSEGGQKNEFSTVAPRKFNGDIFG